MSFSSFKDSVVYFLTLFEKMCGSVSINGVFFRPKSTYIWFECSIDKWIYVFLRLVKIRLVIYHWIILRESCRIQGTTWVIITNEFHCSQIQSNNYQEGGKKDIHYEVFSVTSHHDQLFSRKGEDLVAEVFLVGFSNRIIVELFIFDLFKLFLLVFAMTYLEKNFF